jgi:cobalt/nickel transport system permease protein
MHATLDTIAHTNRLRDTDTRLKLIYTIITLLIVVASPSPVTPLLVFTLTSLLILFAAKIKPKIYLLLLSAPLFFGLTALLLMSMFFGYGTPIHSFEVFSHTLNIRDTGVNMGVLVLSRTLAGSSCLFFLALTTPMTELFAVSRQLRIPDVLVELSMMIYRYIFVFLEEAQRMYLAQQMRGLEGLRAQLNAFSMLASSLFLRTIHQGEKLFIAMNARCYNGEPHTLNFQPQKTKLNLQALSLILLFEAALGILAFITRNTTLL